jgi:uncharacterized protein (DUF58 family)
VSAPVAETLGFDEAFLRRLARLGLAVRRDRTGQSAGHRRSPARGSSVEFADFRTYTLGDDLRRVDWNVYARLGRLFLRLYHDDQNATLHLLLDVSPSMDWGDDETNKLRWAKRLAGALGYVALSGLDRVTIAPVAAGVVGRPSGFSGAQSALRLFAYLGSLPVAEEVTDLDRALGRYGARPPGPIVLISDLLCPNAGREGLRRLAAAGNDVAVVHVLAPSEEEPEVRGDLRLVDRETGEAREVTVDEALLDRYRAGVAAWREEVRAACHERGIGYVPIRSDLPVEDVVLDALRRERVVA